MTTEEQRERANNSEERELSLISQGEQVLAELTGQIGVYFRRAEVRKRARRCQDSEMLIMKKARRVI